LGPLPKGSKTLIISGACAFNPWYDTPDGNDGVVAANETQLPGNQYYWEESVRCPHSLLPMHPTSMRLIREFIENN
jgi:hypothetical protein